MSHLQKVAQFTSESGFSLPSGPREMSAEECRFLVKMVMDECYELLITKNSPEGARNIMTGIATDLELRESAKIEPVVAEQADALVDIEYYIHNAAAKAGIDTDKVFDVVHDANMAKKWADGTFHRRDDGKIIKPDGWKEPDIVALFRETKVSP